MDCMWCNHCRARNGRNYVIDGGHRVLASRHRADIEKLPCLVFDTSDVVEEGARFFECEHPEAANVVRGQSSQAMEVVGDPTAVKIHELLVAEGYEAMSHSGLGSMGKVKCIKTLMDCYASNPEAFLSVWPLILEILKANRSMRGWLDLFLCGDGCVTSRHQLDPRRRGGQVDYSHGIAWNPRGNQPGSGSYYARGGYKVWAKGLVDALNHGVRNRLEIIDVDTSKNEETE